MKIKRFTKLILPILLICLILVPIPTSKAADIKTSAISLNSRSAPIITGKTFLLKVFNTTSKHTIHFKSLNKSIASVNRTGLIKGIKPGKTFIRVTIKYENRRTMTLKCQVKVGPPAFSVVFSRHSLTMSLGSNKILRAYVKPNTSVEVPFFSSSDSSIASVNKKGVITAFKTGTVTITATASNGQFDTCNILVVDSVQPSPSIPYQSSLE